LDDKKRLFYETQMYVKTSEGGVEGERTSSSKNILNAGYLIKRKGNRGSYHLPC